ncbi:MAG: hypothetical protein PWQ12_2162 [Clostridiales bacterium]|jgi:hypothetical protein|nr:hypothetical protein [Clostridiales bacterium]
MKIEVFNRYEKKFLLDAAAYERLKSFLETRMIPDQNSQNDGFYTISNVYYDTVADDLIKKSLSKPLYKEKLRLRSYGVPSPDDTVFLEIKKKYKGLVNKRRTEISLKDADAFIKNGEMPAPKPYHNRQVMREIDFFLKRYQVAPAVYIAYDRKALFSDDLRITFDTRIRTRREDVGLEKGDHGKLLLPEGLWLMEVKATDALPLWFVHQLSEMKLYPVSFSKYGTEYCQFAEAHDRQSVSDKNEERGVEVQCLNPYLLIQPASQFQ